MEFDSPEEVEKEEFPGLYGKPEQVEMMSDPVDYDDELDKKKKKGKKDSKKDYATLADENSQDEEDGGESHQAKKKLKGLLSGKKKDKDKEKDKEAKDSKKEKKLLEKEKKTLDTSTSEVPFSNVRIPFSAERHRDINAHRSSVPTALFVSTPKASSSKDKSGGESSCSPVAASVEKERSSSSAFNVFINAPTPLFLQKKKKKKEEKELKEKEHKKDKSSKSSKDKKEDKPDKEKHASGVAKVKLKLMRSKNSLDDPHEKEKAEKGGELHVSISHQFPEDPESLAKEIKKHEALLEQTHGHMKSCKKVTKKQEEQLWELQRTLTALKRKLRSINALSSAPHPTHAGPSSSSASTSQSPQSNTIPLPSVSPNCAVVSLEKNKTTHYIKHGCETEILSKTSSSLSSSPIVKNDITNEPSHQEIQGCENVPIKISATSEVEVESHHHDKETVPVMIIPPPAKNANKKTARRSLDFSDIIVDNNPNKKQVVVVKSNNESRIQTCCSSAAVESCVQEDKVDDEEGGASIITTSFEDSTQKQIPPPVDHQRRASLPLLPSNNNTEHEKIKVQVVVHQESKEEEEDVDEIDGTGGGNVDNDDDSSVARSEDDEEEEEDDDEAFPASSRTEENINVILDDANAMIGSMHEELEAAAFVFGQKLSKRGGGSSFGGKHALTTVSKSEPTFETNESSDVELIRDEEEDEDEQFTESFIEELIPELLCLPEFETPEYLIFENEQLATFNKAIQEEIIKEEAELEIVMQELENIRATTAKNNDLSTKTEDDSSEDDMERLIEVWKTAKSENDVLQANVSRLRQLVALHRLDEFRLETRVRFLEDKFQPIISPITTTTPLHSETFNA